MSENSSHHRIDIILAVVTHVTMVMLVLVLILFFVPVFGELYANGGRISGATMFMLNASGFCRTWGIFLIPAIGILAYLDAKLLSFLSRENAGAKSSVFVFGFILAMSAAQLFVIWATLLPII